MNYSEFQIPENLLEDFDVDLQEFYYDVLEKIQSRLPAQKKMKISDIKEAFRKVVNAYKKHTVEGNASFILFNTPEKRYAYVMKHCACFSSAVANHFLQMVKANPSNLLSALHNRRVNLCCLGGGPGTEAVAIVKVINAFNDAFFFFRRQKLRLNVQVVDLSEDWVKTTKLVLKMANSTPELCDPDRVDIRFKFLEGDLTEPFEERVRKAMGKADIITMVYFVSAVNGSKAQGKCASMLKNILDSAKEEAFLFFLDSSKALHYHAVNSMVGPNENFKRIYGPIDQQFHTLSSKSIRRFIKLYYAKFNGLFCLTNCFITCATWIKGETRTSSGTINDSTCVPCCYSGFGANCKRRRKKAACKRMEECTQEQRRFRDWVRWIVFSEVKRKFAKSNLVEIDGCEHNFEPWLHEPCKIEILRASKSKHKRINKDFLLGCEFVTRHHM